MKMNGGQMVCASLIREGVDVIFGASGRRDTAPVPDFA